MRLLPLLPLLISTALYAQSPQNSPPLTDEDKRQILVQLYELRSCRQEVLSYEAFVARESDQVGREKDNAARALDLERQATAIAQKERDLALERTSLYEQLYRSVTNGPGLGCRILRVVSLGIVRCQ